jgi:hypothetical protein
MESPADLAGVLAGATRSFRPATYNRRVAEAASRRGQLLGLTEDVATPRVRDISAQAAGDLHAAVRAGAGFISTSPST